MLRLTGKITPSNGVWLEFLVSDIVAINNGIGAIVLVNGEYRVVDPTTIEVVEDGGQRRQSTMNELRSIINNSAVVVLRQAKARINSLEEPQMRWDDYADGYQDAINDVCLILDEMEAKL